MPRPPPAHRLSARLACLALPATMLGWLGCGVPNGAMQNDSISRCQRLADKTSLCPDLFGMAVYGYFLASPGPLPLSRRNNAGVSPVVVQPATPAPVVAVAPSREVQACAYRVSGSSDPCQSAFTALIGCIEPPICSAVASACAAPLAQIKIACAALFGRS